MEKTKLFLSSILHRLRSSDLLTRAAHTFIQAFVAVLLVTGFKLDKTALAAALAAAISATKTYVITTLRNGE